jgi:hypothetical protein
VTIARECGPRFINAAPYLYPMVMSSIIFLALLTDSLRRALWRKLRRQQR